MEQIELERAQKELSHYLVRGRSVQNLTQKQAAAIMNMSLTSYRTYESESNQKNKVITAVETLKDFARFRNYDPEDFFSVLVSGNKRRKENLRNDSSSLDDWQVDLLATLDNHCSHDVRLAFSEALGNIKTKDLGEFLSLMTTIAKLKDGKAKYILTGIVELFLKASTH